MIPINVSYLSTIWIIYLLDLIYQKYEIVASSAQNIYLQN